MEQKLTSDLTVRKTLPKMVAVQYGLSEEKAREVMSRIFYPTLERWQDYF